MFALLRTLPTSVLSFERTFERGHEKQYAHSDELSQAQKVKSTMSVEEEKKNSICNDVIRHAYAFEILIYRFSPEYKRR